MPAPFAARPEGQPPPGDSASPTTRLTRSYQPKFFLSYSPDGSHITYTRHHANRRASQQILMGLWIVDADGSNERRLLTAHDRDVQIQEHAAWSPDGKRLAISGGGNDTGNAAKDVFVCEVENFDASNLRKLVPGPSVNVGEQPNWSPDGKQLVVTTTATTLWVIDADGKNRRKLTQQPGTYVMQPAWSPDGERIGFASDRDGNCEIYTIRPDGTELTRLTNHPSIDCHPKWSPDGQWIAFTSNRDGNNEIYVVRPDGSGLDNLTRHAAFDDHPAWSPDGRTLAFASMRDGGFDIYSMPVPAGLHVAARPPKSSKATTPTAAADATQPIRTDGLVLCYDFDQGAGPALRDQTGPNHAILNGATWTKTKSGHALAFDGKESYVDCANHACLRISGPLTITAWVKTAGSDHNQYVVAKHGWNIYIGTDLIPRFETRTAADNAWDTLAASRPLRVRQWECIAIVFNLQSKRNEIYVNGELSNSSPRTDGALGAAAGYNLELGRYGPGRSQHLNGWLDELRIYDRALPAGEVKRRYEVESKSIGNPSE
jgi:Tol biopolymer transport system component